MKPAIPLGPILLILIAVTIFVTAVLVYSAPLSPKLTRLPEIAPALQNTQRMKPLNVNDQNQRKEATKAILETSSFASDRSAFLRRREQTQVKQQELTPEFVGAMGEGSRRRIMIIWRRGEDTKIHSVGDQTPWGTLVSITETEATFERPSGAKSLKLF